MKDRGNLIMFNCSTCVLIMRILKYKKTFINFFKSPFCRGLTFLCLHSGLTPLREMFLPSPNNSVTVTRDGIYPPKSVYGVLEIDKGIPN